MRKSAALGGIAIALGLVLCAPRAQANVRADYYTEPQPPGKRLSLFAFIGPGFRAIYDHRIEIEPDMSELRLQVMGDANWGYSEGSVNADLRLFLLNFGASAGYHYDWHFIQWKSALDQAGKPTGFDLAGQHPPAPGGGYNTLDMQSRITKDSNGDFTTKTWAWYEGRLGAYIPGDKFMGLTMAGLRYEGRPQDSYDWYNGTVMSGGWHLRWESYAFFKDRNLGFIGPALRIMNVPRTLQQDAPPSSPGGLCGPGGNAVCDQEHRVWELHYGVAAGMRPNWVAGGDVVLFRFFTTAGLDSGPFRSTSFNNHLYGTHTFQLPIQFLIGYQADIVL